MGIFKLTRKPTPPTNYPPTTYPLRSCILEFERLSPTDQTLGSIKSISVEEFEFLNPSFSATSAPNVDFSPCLLTYANLVEILKEEMRYDEEREVIYYVVEGRSDGFREVKSDVSLRGALRMLRSGGGWVLRLYVKRKAEFLEVPRRRKIGVAANAGEEQKRRKKPMLGRQQKLEEGAARVDREGNERRKMLGRQYKLEEKNEGENERSSEEN